MNTSDMIFALSISWAAFGMAIPTAVKLAPTPQTGDLFAVENIRAERDGETLALYVTREIKAPVHMAANVRVMRREGTRWIQDCSATGPTTLYMPDAELEQPVSLSWWTWGQCEAVPDVPLRIVTTWQPTAPGMQPVTHVTEVQ